MAQIPLVQAPPTSAYPIQVPMAQVLPIPAATIQAPLSVLLAPSPPAENSYKQLEIYPEQVKIMSDKLDIFTNKHANIQLFAFGQKKIQKLLEKDVFKLVTPDKIVISEEVSSNT